MLLPHNIPVYERFEAMLAEQGRVILVTATGTGKSYVTEEYIRNHQLKTLVVCPKLSIGSQWLEMTDLVETMTYHKFSKQTDLSVFEEFDCFVFDEAHHCGSPIWGNAVERLMEETDKPVIGLTADSRRFSDGGKDVAEEVWDNCVVYGYDQAKAIEEGILPAATYVCTMFDAAKIAEEYKAKGNQVSPVLLGRLDLSLENCGKVKDILYKHNPPGNRKGIVFVDRIDSIDEAVALISDVYPYTNILIAHSAMSQTAVDAAIGAFKELDEGYLVVVDMLNEGLHIDGVNTIIMLRRTASPMIFMQQCGRALATGNENVVIFDFVGNNQSLKIIATRVSEMSRIGLPEKRAGRRSEQVIIHDYASEFLSVIAEINEELSNKWKPEEDEILREFWPKEGKRVAERLPGRTPNACKQRAVTFDIKCKDETFDPWTPEEDEILRTFYPKEGRRVSRRLPGRSQGACKGRARKLGFKTEYYFWSEKEDEILRAVYPTGGKNEASKLLPGRTPQECRSRANKLGIHSNIQVRAWTPEEDEQLRAIFPTQGADAVARVLDRTVDACLNRANYLGLHKEVWKKSAAAWSDEEIAILRKYYPTEGYGVSKRIPGKTPRACATKAERLGIKSSARKPQLKAWTKTEIDILTQYYPTEGAAVVQRLPGRTEQACMTTANQLGIHSNQRNKTWTPEEDALLRNFYLSEGQAVSNRLQGRTGSACSQRAKKLGIVTQRRT